MHHLRIAHGCAKETDTHLRVLLTAGVIDHVSAARALRLLDDVRAMTEPGLFTSFLLRPTMHPP
jgi:hypothetical protein